MVKHIQALMQADEIALRLESAGPASAIEIRDIGRTPHGREIDPRAAHGQGPLGIAGVQGECLGRLGDQFSDEAAIEAHHACRPVDHGAVTFQNVESLRVLEFEAQLLEDSQGDIVDERKLALVEERQRRHRIAEFLPRGLPAAAR